MEKGKRICQALKELRKRIAEANDIPFEIEECTHKGDCPGTCPKCEADVRYLMECIDMREQEGKPVVIEGLMNEDELRKAFSIDSVEQDIPENPDDFVTMGMPEPPTPEVLMGDIAAPLEGQEMLAPSYDFAATIAKELLANTKGNIVFSPAGLCRILEMLREGMDKNSDIYDKVCCLIDGFNSEIETWDVDDFKLEHAASIWYNKALGIIKDEYLDTLEDAYNSEAHNADFAKKTKTKLWIDKWVSDNTNKMIKSLDTEISTDSLLVLLDAIYMNGKWENPFDPDLTEADTFYNVDDTEAEVDMMYQELEDADYAETDEYQVINIPYKNFDFCMTVVLPKNGVSIDSIMERTDWLDVDSDFCNVDLFMPRFKFDNTLSFKDILKGLGLSDLFEKEDSLPGITDLPAHISEIKQQCVIAVEEEGTEAAAVTMAECEVGCLPSDDIPQTVTMKLDRPFGFAIKGEYNQVVFMGVVRNMNQNKD